MDALAESLSDNHRASPAGPAPAEAAEHDLLRHLAMMGELFDRRDLLQAELAGVEQLLNQARQQKAALIQRVQILGGQLPTWQMG